MTNDEWKRAEELLLSLAYILKLNVDGYMIEAVAERHGYRLRIMVYVNGKFLGKWLVEDCEERRRFLCCKEKSFMTAKQKADLKKKSKKFQKEFWEQWGNKITYKEYSPWFDSVAALRKHLEANNSSIELISEL